MQAIRILQVVGAMNRAGLETWLMHVLRHVDRDRYRMDFLVHTPEEGDYDAEIRELGGRILRCSRPGLKLWQYVRELRTVLRENGPYDVVHVHVDHAGIVVRLAAKQGIPVRIVHSHNAASPVQMSKSVLRKVVLAGTNLWVSQHATCGLGCSRPAAAAWFGPRWDWDPRWRVLYYGIDLNPYRIDVDRAAVRHELGLPQDALIVGHIGRFDRQKNHGFLLTIVKALVRCNPRVHVLLVGDGELRPQIETRIEQLDLKNHVHLLGVRSDVPRLLKGAMDAFLLPSFYEGLPVTVLEAQAAGVPAAISDAIADETDYLPELIRRHSLQEGAEEWAKTTLNLISSARILSDSDALAKMERGPFNIDQSVYRLCEVYSGSERLGRVAQQPAVTP